VMVFSFQRKHVDHAAGIHLIHINRDGALHQLRALRHDRRIELEIGHGAARVVAVGRAGDQQFLIGAMIRIQVRRNHIGVIAQALRYARAN